MEVAVLVPIKAFRDAKGRLAGHLSPAVRAELARAMAGRVLAAAAPHPTFVICDDDAVADWAAERGAEVLWTPGLGLNGAIDHGAAAVVGKGAEHLVIAHSDLPLATGFTQLVESGTVTLVPDYRFDGTNVQARPAGCALPSAYGAGSFRHHLAAGLDAGCRVRVVTDASLARDVDTIDDCRHPAVLAELGELLGHALDGAPAARSDAP